MTLRAGWIPIMVWAGVAGLLACAGGVAAEKRAATLPAAGWLDESAFREGLRRRGLGEWLAQYEVDHPPADAVDARLRRREALLAELDESNVPPYERRPKIEQAHAILTSLIESQPDHPARLSWMLASAAPGTDRAGGVLPRFDVRAARSGPADGGRSQQPGDRDIKRASRVSGTHVGRRGGAR